MQTMDKHNAVESLDLCDDNLETHESRDKNKASIGSSHVKRALRHSIL